MICTRMHTLAGDDHNFHYAVYLLVMSIMALIILFACTFKFEKHCRCAPPLLPVMLSPTSPAVCLPRRAALFYPARIPGVLASREGRRGSGSCGGLLPPASVLYFTVACAVFVRSQLARSSCGGGIVWRL